MNKLLSIGQVARELGVHTQTLRSWERKGLIRAIRLPGSRYRRFTQEEVERLKEGMGLGQKVGQGVRQRSTDLGRRAPNEALEAARWLDEARRRTGPIGARVVELIREGRRR